MEELERQKIINQIMSMNDEDDNDVMSRGFLETLTLQELQNLQELNL